MEDIDHSTALDGQRSATDPATDQSAMSDDSPVLVTPPSPIPATPPSPTPPVPLSAASSSSTIEQATTAAEAEAPSVSVPEDAAQKNQQVNAAAAIAAPAVAPAAPSPSADPPSSTSTSFSPPTPSTSATPPLPSPSAYIQPLLTSTTSLLSSLTALLTHYHSSLALFDRRRIQPWLVSAERYLERQAEREDELVGKEEEMRREVEEFVNKMKGWQELLQQRHGGAAGGRAAQQPLLRR